MSQIDPTQEAREPNSITDRLPEAPTAGQMGGLGLIITVLGVAAFTLSYNGITLFGPMEMAVGVVGAGLSLVLAGAITKATEAV
jgi:hypothetical protein